MNTMDVQSAQYLKKLEAHQYLLRVNCLSSQLPTLFHFTITGI